jgi:hypothetical protein
VILFSPESRSDEPRYRLIQAIETQSADPPPINDSNQAAYFDYSQSNGLSVHRLNAGSTSIDIATFDPNRSNLLAGPGINSAGEVSFVQSYFTETNTANIYVGDGSSLNIVGLGDYSVSPISITEISNQSISDDGTVVWKSGQSFYFSNGDGNVTELSPPSGYTAFRIGISGSGQIAFSTLDALGNGQLFLRELDGSITLLASNTNHLAIEFSLNSNGQILFANNGSMYLTDGGQDPILVESIASSPNFASLAINNNGDYAFTRINGAENALYAHISEFGDTREILSKGDDFLGGKINSIYLGTGGFNSNDLIAFSYGLKGGKSGIAVIKVVPESSSIVFIGVVAAIFIAYLTLSRRSFRTGRINRPIELGTSGSSELH